MAGCFEELAEALRTGVDEDGLAEIAGRSPMEVLIVQLAVIGSVLDPDTAPAGGERRIRPGVGGRPRGLTVLTCGGTMAA